MGGGAVRGENRGDFQFLFIDNNIVVGSPAQIIHIPSLKLVARQDLRLETVFIFIPRTRVQVKKEQARNGQLFNVTASEKTM